MKFNHFVFATLVFIAVGCSNAKKDGASDDIKSVPTMSVSKRDTIINNVYVADIQAKKNVEVHALIGGLLEKVHVNEGQVVKKGQLMFKISDLQLQIDLQKSIAIQKSVRAELKIAAVELKQMQTLFEKNVVADNELELAKAKHQAAEAKLEQANAEVSGIKQIISFTNILAPFDGIIDRIPFKEGSLIQNGSLLTTVSELDEVFAYFALSEDAYFNLIQNGDLSRSGDILLILPNGQQFDFNGKLESAEGEIDRATGSISFKAKFPNPGNIIKHGTSGKLLIQEDKKGAILVPQKAVFAIQDRFYVFVYNKTSKKVKQRQIEISNTLSEDYIVRSGLKVGDIIVVEGTQSLRDGDIIESKKYNKVVK